MPDTTLEALPSGDVAAALEAAEKHAQILPDVVDDGTLIVVAHRDDRVVEQIDLERYEAQPTRPRGTVKALTADGFVAAHKQLAGPEGRADAVIYANPDSCALVAVLNDDHQDGGPGWRDHRIQLSLQTTPEWQHWTTNKGLKSQQQFAEIIEAGEDDIIGTPSATTMLEIAQTFHASIGAKFKQQGILRSGKTQLVYEEDIDAKGQTSEGLVDLPDSFTVAVRPFYGAEPRELVCKLRFRIKGGELAIGYTLNRPDEVKREAFATDVVGFVREQLTDATVIEGVPAEPTSAGR